MANMGKQWRSADARRKHAKDMARMRATKINQIIIEKDKELTPEPPIPCVRSSCWCYGKHGCEGRKICDAMF